MRPTYYFLIAIFLTLQLRTHGQSGNGVGIGTAQVNANAILHINSATKGVFLPVLTSVNRKRLNGPNGLFVYDSDQGAIYYYSGGWHRMWFADVGNGDIGNFNVGGQKVYNLANGTAANDAVNKSQLDTKANTTALNNAVAARVAKSGDTMTGVLNMGANKVTNVANGTAANDAVNKSQLDAATGPTRWSRRGTSTPITTNPRSVSVDVGSAGTRNIDLTAWVSYTRGSITIQVRGSTAPIGGQNAGTLILQRNFNSGINTATQSNLVFHVPNTNFRYFQARFTPTGSNGMSDYGLTVEQAR